MSGGEKTTACFAKGCNCCQSVLAGFCDIVGMTEEDAMKMGAVFGGSTGAHLTCGAVTGAYIVLGMLSDVDNCDAADAKAQAEEKARFFRKRFEEKFGSINCYGVLDIDKTTDEGRRIYREKAEAYKAVCREAVREAGLVLEEIIAGNALEPDAEV